MLFPRSVADRLAPVTRRDATRARVKRRAEARIQRLIRELQSDPALLEDDPSQVERLEALLEQLAHAVREDVRRCNMTDAEGYTDRDLQQLFSFAMNYWCDHAEFGWDEDDFDLLDDEWQTAALAQWKLVHACGLHTVCRMTEE